MDYRRRTARVDFALSLLRRVEALIAAIVLLLVACMILEMIAYGDAGHIPGGFNGFDELRERNPDIVAWIRMDGTHIDHPVVQGRDNFEYLSRDIDGEYCRSGSIFLDAGNSRDMSDRYIIMHGHHMARGAMFSDVAEYLGEDFFEKNSRGELITPQGIYGLTVMAAGTVDAYDGKVYHTGREVEPPFEVPAAFVMKRDVPFDSGDKLVMLSTCAGDMTSCRAVAFCRARYVGAYHEEDYAKTKTEEQGR